MIAAFIRHGQTDWNREGLLQGSSDIPLNDTGRAQARDALMTLRSMPWDVVVSSPLRRARETAQIIADALGLELGGTLGPFYAFGEYGERHVHGGPAAAFGNAKIKALSINGGFWITGEKPTYASRSGTYLAPNVLHSVLDGGWGALEAVVRYEDLDTTDLPFGGSGQAGTVGLNWSLTNNFRFMADYIHFRTDNVTGDYKGRDTGDTFAARAEVAF